MLGSTNCCRHYDRNYDQTNDKINFLWFYANIERFLEKVSLPHTSINNSVQNNWKNCFVNSRVLACSSNPRVQTETLKCRCFSVVNYARTALYFRTIFFCKNNLKDLGYNPVVIELSLIHFIIKIINETSRPFWQKNHRFFNMIFKNSRLFNKRSWRAFIFRIYWLRPLLSNDGQTKNFR